MQNFPVKCTYVIAERLSVTEIVIDFFFILLFLLNDLLFCRLYLCDFLTSVCSVIFSLSVFLTSIH